MKRKYMTQNMLLQIFQYFKTGEIHGYRNKVEFLIWGLVVGGFRGLNNPNRTMPMLP